MSDRAGAGSEHADAHRRKGSRYIAALQLVTVLGATAWSFAHRHELMSLQHRLNGVGYVAAVFIFGVAIAVTGYALLVASLAPAQRRGRSPFSRHPAERTRELRSMVAELVRNAPDRRRFKLGWYLSFLGAVVQPAVVVVGSIALLPRSLWTLAIPASVDVTLVLVTRISIHHHLVRRWNANRLPVTS